MYLHKGSVTSKNKELKQHEHLELTFNSSQNITDIFEFPSLNMYMYF